MGKFSLQSLLLWVTIISLFVWIVVSSRNQKRLSDALVHRVNTLETENASLKQDSIGRQHAILMQFGTELLIEHNVGQHPSQRSPFVDSKLELFGQIAENLAPHYPHDSFVWLALINTGRLHNGMTLADVEKLIGSHSKFTDDFSTLVESEHVSTSKILDFLDRNRHVHPSYMWFETKSKSYLKARVKDDLLYGWEISTAHKTLPD